MNRCSGTLCGGRAAKASCIVNFDLSDNPPDYRTDPYGSVLVGGTAGTMFNEGASGGQKKSREDFVAKQRQEREARAAEKRGGFPLPNLPGIMIFNRLTNNPFFLLNEGNAALKIQRVNRRPNNQNHKA